VVDGKTSSRKKEEEEELEVCGK
jgi:hypothetical protein